MKTIRAFSLLLSGLLATTSLFAITNNPAKQPDSRIKVVFDHPEKFTDVKDALMPTEKGRDDILRDLRESFQQAAERRLPEGYTMTITFSDIDLAGDFEPQHGPEWDNIRVVKAIYPPNFEFTYTITNGVGEVVKEGKEKLRDLSFDMRIGSMHRPDSLHIEKDMLEDWLRGVTRGLKKS